jgi:NAD(P)H-hydrate epimerase
MRAIDEAAAESVDELIERAGRRLARTARQMLGGVYGRRVVAIAGPGNNGADARVAARVLETAGVRTRVVDPSETKLPDCDLVIDGAFGTGISRPFHGAETTAPVLAVDIPSGVNGLTGELVGAPVRATHTLTFAALKPGLLLQPGADWSGNVEIADIGLSTDHVERWLFTRSDAVRSVPVRPSNDHKWRRAVAVIGGSPGMSGAPLLAAEAAFRSGAGMVRAQMPGAEIPTQRSEIVMESIPTSGWADAALRDRERFHSVVLGPGLASDTGPDVAAVLDGLDPNTPVVLDATALRLVGRHPELRPSVILTPHEGEFAALAGAGPSADRFEACRDLAARTNATVLLKGPLTIVAAPDGRAIAVGHGDARLAVAGSGDVLSGAIAAFAAAGLEPILAAALGAWVHADAGHQLPLLGGIASDLLSGLAHSVSDLVAHRPRGHHAAN